MNSPNELSKRARRKLLGLGRLPRTPPVKIAVGYFILITAYLCICFLLSFITLKNTCNIHAKGLNHKYVYVMDVLARRTNKCQVYREPKHKSNGHTINHASYQIV